jgi:hypothetical protein
LEARYRVSIGQAGVRSEVRLIAKKCKKINWQFICLYVVRAFILIMKDCYMAKTAKKIAKRKPWSKDEHRALKAHSKAKTPVVKISKQTNAPLALCASRRSSLVLALATNARGLAG